MNTIHEDFDALAKTALRVKRDRDDLLETMRLIADFAPGNGDVCEIIAQRARAAIERAEATR